VVLRLVLPHAHNTTELQQAVVHGVICLCSQHALHKVLRVAEDEAVPLSAGTVRTFGSEGFDMETLQHRDRKLSLGALGVVEDGPSQPSQTGFAQWSPELGLNLLDGPLGNLLRHLDS
jgi:hypothetical protein